MNNISSTTQLVINSKRYVKALYILSYFLILLSFFHLLYLSFWNTITDLLNGFYSLFITRLSHVYFINKFMYLHGPVLNPAANTAADAADMNDNAYFFSYDYFESSSNNNNNPAHPGSAHYMTRLNVNDNTIVENIICFGFFMFFNTMLEVLTLMNILYDKAFSNEKLEQWQVTSAVVVSSIALFIYFMILLCIFSLYRKISKIIENSLPAMDNEAHPLFRHGVGGGRYGTGSGTVPTVPTGRLVTPPATQNQGDTTRFPGKGRSLREGNWDGGKDSGV